jgi:hypothetical protein
LHRNLQQTHLQPTPILEKNTWTNAEDTMNLPSTDPYTNSIPDL